MGDWGLERAQPQVPDTKSAAQASRMWRKLAWSNRLGHLTLWPLLPARANIAAGRTTLARNTAVIVASRSPKRRPRAPLLLPAAAVAWSLARAGGGPSRRVKAGTRTAWPPTHPARCADRYRVRAAREATAVPRPTAAPITPSH